MKKLYFFILLLLPLLSFSQYDVDFDGPDDGTNASAYGFTDHDLNGITWTGVQSIIPTTPLAAEWFNGVRSLRLRGYGTSTFEMSSNKSNGIGVIQFSYRRYGTDAQVDWKVEYSTNNGVDWTQVGDVFTAPASDDIQVFSETVNVDGDVRIRIKRETEEGGVNRRLNIDDLLITDFGTVAPPSISVTTPTNNTVFNPFVTAVDVALSVNNFNVGNQPSDDGFIKYNVNGGTTINKFDTAPINLTGLTPGAYTVNLELVNTAGNSLSPAVNTSLDFIIAALNSSANIAAVKADFAIEGDGQFYELNSEAIVTYTRANRNQKYIQDGTGGLLIDDPDAIITSSLNENDGIVNLKFETVLFNGVLQARPIENISANSTGNTVTPTVLTISDYVDNFIEYESTLIQLNNVSFVEGDGVETFIVNTNYTITDGTNDVQFRTIFNEVDYLGEVIPNALANRIFIATRTTTIPRVISRNMEDLRLSNAQFNSINFSLYPNPVSNGLVTINTTNSDPINVLVYDVLGKQVKNETITNKSLNVGDLNTGIYILKLTQNQATVTKKLIIK